MNNILQKRILELSHENNLLKEEIQKLKNNLNEEEYDAWKDAQLTGDYYGGSRGRIRGLTRKERGEPEPPPRQKTPEEIKREEKNKTYFAHKDDAPHKSFGSGPMVWQAKMHDTHYDISGKGVKEKISAYAARDRTGHITYHVGFANDMKPHQDAQAAANYGNGPIQNGLGHHPSSQAALDNFVQHYRNRTGSFAPDPYGYSTNRYQGD